MSVSSWEFAHNLALASTGMLSAHEPEVHIEHVEQGVYRLSVDKAEIVLTSQDLRDICDWCLLHMREIEQQAAAAGETPSDWKIRKSPRD